MERISATATMHPMARFIMESDRHDPYEHTFYQTEEKNLMSLLLIYIEATTKVSFNNPFLRKDAIESLQELLHQLNDFSSIQNLLADNQVDDKELNHLWETDAFFIISPPTEKVFHEQGIMRKNVCLTTLKRRVERWSFQFTN